MLTLAVLLGAAATATSTTTLVVQFAVAILAPSGLATLITALYMRRNIKAQTGKLEAESDHTEVDAVQILTNTSVSLLEPMQKQITFLTEQLENANKQIVALTDKVDGLNDKLDRYQELHGDLPPVV